jgi:hypothetical protein
MKNSTPKPFSKRTPEDIYLEYVNDWLTVERMADNYGRAEEEMRTIIEKGKADHMKATAITVSHRKEKDVNIYTATRGPYELEIANVGHLEVIEATEKDPSGTIYDISHTSILFKPFFEAIEQFKKANDQCTPTS